MRSIKTKLVVSIALIAILQALIVSVWVRLSTEEAFEKFLREDAVEGFVENAVQYFEENNSWAGIESGRPNLNRAVDDLRGSGRESAVLRPPPNRNQPPRPGRRRDDGAPRFGLTDANGTVLISHDQFAIGAQVPESERQAHLPIRLGDRVIGWALIPEGRLPLGGPEISYITQTNQALVVAALFGLSVAVLIGLIVAGRLSAPIRSLTAATKRLADGDLDVAVQSDRQDEIGELTRSFNAMSISLRTLEDARNQMTADISHDLRTPITVISGYLEAIQTGDLDPTPDRMALIQTEAKKLETLVEDLRTVSLADAGALRLSKTSVAPHIFLGAIARTFSEEARTSGISLDVRVDEPLALLEMDEPAMNRVFGNLVSNALRHTPSGGRIELSAQYDGECIRFDVLDSGTGIPEEKLPFLFDRFFRADPSRSGDAGDSGLGLTIVQSIVEAHSGKVFALNNEGPGACFSIYLSPERIEGEPL